MLEEISPSPQYTHTYRLLLRVLELLWRSIGYHQLWFFSICESPWFCSVCLWGYMGWFSVQ